MTLERDTRKLKQDVARLLRTKGVVGPPGPTGATGATGSTGADGADGAGVATGGLVNQALIKLSGANFDTDWATISFIL